MGEPPSFRGLPESHQGMPRYRLLTHSSGHQGENLSRLTSSSPYGRASVFRGFSREPLGQFFPHSHQSKTRYGLLTHSSVLVVPGEDIDHENKRVCIILLDATQFYMWYRFRSEAYFLVVVFLSRVVIRSERFSRPFRSGPL